MFISGYILGALSLYIYQRFGSTLFQLVKRTEAKVTADLNKVNKD